MWMQRGGLLVNESMDQQDGRRAESFNQGFSRC